MLARLMIASFLLAATCPAQATLRVPSRYPTIQAAADAAIAGDTVLVGPGTYAENLVVSKAITVRSTHGPEVTIVTDPPGIADTVVDADSGAAIEGLSVVGGIGMRVHAPVVVQGCIIRDAQDTGLTVFGASSPGSIAVIVSCIIRDNHGAAGSPSGGSSGGCIPEPTRGNPGGLAIHGPGVHVLNSMIIDNVGGDAGTWTGACSGAGRNGGAGGVEMLSGGSLHHCTLAGNVGGAGDCLTAVSCGQDGPGGIHHAFGSFLQSSIVWGNSQPSVASIGPPLPCSASNVEGGGGGGYLCLDVDPLFADAGAGDYRLTAASPCRDTGLAAFAATLLTDFEGNPRRLGANVDMGADEHAPRRHGTGDGLEITTRLDGFGAGLDAKLAPAGSAFVVELVDVGGNLGGAAPMLYGQVFGVDSPPNGFPGFGYHFDPFQVAVFYNGLVTPGPPIGPVPVVFGPVTIPAGLVGLVLRLQGFAMTPAAANTFFASTRAIDHHFKG